jgi:hypothetical protein
VTASLSCITDCEIMALHAYNFKSCIDAGVCRGARACVTIDHLRHLALQTFWGHRAYTDIYSPTKCRQVLDALHAKKALVEGGRAAVAAAQVSQGPQPQ